MVTRRGLFAKPARRSGRPTRLAAPRLAAIRVIIELAGDAKSRDAAAASLLVLGVSPHEIAAATLGELDEEPVTRSDPTTLEGSPASFMGTSRQDRPR